MGTVTAGSTPQVTNSGTDSAAVLDFVLPKGDKGEPGIPGPQGEPGADGWNGATFTPAVDSAGNLSWTNNGGLVNPAAVNLKGPQGEKGDPGEPAAAGWEIIAEYTAAGAYTWTAPDLNQGQPYTIGVWMCGGGGSGGLGTYNWKTSGGASGYDANVITQVTPGQTYNLVVGAGGAAITSTNNIAGNNGGSTSAFNRTAAGGNGGGSSSDSTASAIGGQPAAIGLLEKNSMYGGLTIEFATGKYAVPGSSCYNQFTGERKLGAGGGIYSSSSSAYVTGVGGKGPRGLGGGDAVFGNGATAGDATEYGCGGGAVARSNVQSATNGAGADGAILIYYKGGETE